MTIEKLSNGMPFVYMKVGIHARESLADIIKRKREEIAKAGVAFWGYGGNTCHPLNAVQPFAKAAIEKGNTVHLLMQEINSNHLAAPVRAKSYSTDGIKYVSVPPAINVLGSRYALVLKSLDEIDLDLALRDTQVGIGRFLGSPGEGYIRGRVDKACLVFSPGKGDSRAEKISLKLAAQLAEPYAVLLK